ncbi:MAG: hypothetical protein H6779_05245 [Candidatus Nomurabacteria bacterium]|nr:MAG: hypothetical protein H6779_05245 [Candidatus Nomurabacteria bacterium]
MKRLLIFAFVLLLLPAVAWGSSVMRTGELVSLSPDQIVEGDFYGMSDNVAVSGTVTEDLLVLTGDLSINGNVGADLAALAGQVNVHGLISDDARIVAGEVMVDGEIKGDLVVIAKSLKVLPEAKIGGDILFFGGSADIAGVVGGSVLGYNEKLRIDAEVGQGIDVTTKGLVLGDKADIGESIKYVSVTEIVRSQNSHVTGSIVRSDPVFEEKSVARDVLIPFLITTFAALVLYLFFKSFIQRVVLNSQQHALRNILVGLSVVFAVPMVAMILVFSTLGLLLGIALMFIYLTLLVVSFVLAGIITGSFITRPLTKTGEVSIPFIVLGVFSIHAFVYIPVVGFIVLLAVLLMTVGSVSVQLYRLLRN